jgi:hypothetical protein
VTCPDRWTPDTQLIASFLAMTRHRPTVTLSPADRAWVVAGLTLAGKKAEDIAERLGCSLRLVRAIRADPMTQVCLFYQQESETFADELRLAQSEVRIAERERQEILAELGRTKTQLNNLIGPRTFRCGHTADKYNTYMWKDPQGRTRIYCRKCHRGHSASSRSRARMTGSCELSP